MALSRHEPINALWLVLAGVCTFAVSYRFYSAWLMARVLTIDERRAPPAVTANDGKDFIPTNQWVVFGHHFAAISGPGPLVGPVLAAQFGYLPGALWILIGAALGGGVHDAIVLFSSVRRGGRSLGQMLRDEINPLVGTVAMISVLAIMTILLAVLGLVVVNALAESPWGLFTIAATIPIALIMGVAMKSGRISVKAITLFGLLGLSAAVVGGKYLPESWMALLTLSKKELAWWIIAYGLAASILPVWLLLAPRDYLSTFMKIGTVAVLGIIIVILAPGLKMPALTPFASNGQGLVFSGTVFPFVFITIACGAISGFHALISSGTTPKLLDRESVIRRVGYGAMVTEMLVALMALIAACALEPGEYFAINAPAKGKEPAAIVASVNQALTHPDGTMWATPVSMAQMDQLAHDLEEKTMFGRAGGAPTFAVGMAKMFARVLPGETALSLWYHFAIMFEALFILTTIDAGTRVGRFLLQDLLGQIWRPLGRTSSWAANAFASTALVSAWGWFLYQGVVDPLGGINSLWPLFGIANQLLAVIGFCLGTTVLLKMGRACYSFVTFIPLAWLLVVTFSAGWIKITAAAPLGFLKTAESFRTKIAAGGTPVQLHEWHTQAFNNQLDAVVTAAFLLFVIIIVSGCAHRWWKIIRQPEKNPPLESDYIPLDDAPPSLSA
jgi:carbon starvation protein